MTRSAAFFSLFPLLLAGCGDHARLNIAETIGPAPTAAARGPYRRSRPSTSPSATGWPAGATPVAARRPPGRALRHRPRASALAADVCPMATCWSPRPPRRRPTGASGSQHQGLLLPACSMTKAGVGGAERQPHHPAARRRRRRRRRDPHALSHRPELAVRHGAGRLRRSTSPMPMRWSRFPYDPRRDQHHRRAARRSPSCRRGATITGPRAWSPAPTARALCRRRLQFRTSASTAWTRKQERAAIWEIDPATGATASSRPASAIRSASTCSRGTGDAVGGRSTSATSSAATSCPTI